MSGAAAVRRRRVGFGPVATPAMATGDLSRIIPVLAIVAVAWAALIALDVTGAAAMLHHHALIEDGPPLWIALSLFLVAWLVMTTAMMVPLSLPAIRAVTHVRGHVNGLGSDIAILGGFLAVWALFGLAAFAGDMVVHRVVDSTPWLASRPWLIESAVLAFGGCYQFVPRKRRDLQRCRDVTDHHSSAGRNGSTAFGIDHAIACVGASGALMLLMFGQGFGGFGWMVVLTAVMVLETTLRSPWRFTALVGVGLIVLSVATLAGPIPF